MAYIPSNAHWYVADLVEEIHVQGRKRQTAYINTVLIRADSPQQAHEEALKIGRNGNTKYKNLKGEWVRCRFRGIAELNVIHDPLEHGCELFFRSKSNLTEEGLKKLVRKKSEFAVFRPIKPLNKEDHFPAHIAGKLGKRRAG